MLQQQIEERVINSILAMISFLKVRIFNINVLATFQPQDGIEPGIYVLNSKCLHCKLSDAYGGLRLRICQNVKIELMTLLFYSGNLGLERH
ncbi:hypothetical protein [Nostoc sp.]|uniref:hypothetical protein n=1 Tax=Nostoc sp. TaxID=1180 RepID=UPI0035947BE3